jgi:hypothetical protein
MFWTLTVFVIIGGPSITIDGFSNIDDCLALGQYNVTYFQEVPAKFHCIKTGIPPVKCYPDTRKYGRGADCLIKPMEA